MADPKNATLTLSYTVQLDMVATVPTAGITPMVPSVRGAGRTSSALGTPKPALRATAVLLVSDRKEPFSNSCSKMTQESPEPRKKLGILSVCTVKGGSVYVCS